MSSTTRFPQSQGITLSKYFFCLFVEGGQLIFDLRLDLEGRSKRTLGLLVEHLCL